MKTADQLRQAFVDFWTSEPRNAKLIPNVSLVPNNDPTLLFVNSGMFPLVPYLGGEPHPLGTRLCNVQRCIRTIDIDEVGDYSHMTLFEMIGNWSLGDFTKAEQIPWKLELYVEHFGLDPYRIYVSVWEGDETAPRDDEAIEIWKQAFAKYGVTAEFSQERAQVPPTIADSESWQYRIFPYGKEDNWWQRGPDVSGELGGPTSEIFYDLGKEQYPVSAKHINDDSGRFLEVGNSVFMEYQLDDNLDWQPLAQKNIDFGGGFERVVTAAQGKMSAYETDIFMPYIEKLEQLTDSKYDPRQNTETVRSFRIVVEHARAATMLIADGVKPDNKDQGYILRRLIRRMIRHAAKLGLEKKFAGELSAVIIDHLGQAYPQLIEQRDMIINELEQEEQKFSHTLQRGLKQMHKFLNNGTEITGEVAFDLYQTYGFPLEMTIEEFDEQSINVEQLTAEFAQAEQKHQSKSRAGAQQKFSGGLADQSLTVTKLHTAHHLLLAGLQHVLGDHVKQRGSNITGERLRIDFSHDAKLTEEQLQQVTDFVNKQITANLPVQMVQLDKELAEQTGAEMEFGQKYPDRVNVYFIGLDPNVSPSQARPSDYVSAEFCGGPHVENTGQILSADEKFEIYKEQSSGAGIRRIKARIV